MTIFIHTAASLLSVLGAYFLLKILFSLLCKSKNTLAATLLTSREELDALDLSLQSVCADRISAVPTAVLVEKALYHGLSEAEKQKLQKIAAQFGAKLYIVTENK